LLGYHWDVDRVQVNCQVPELANIFELVLKVVVKKFKFVEMLCACFPQVYMPLTVH
jgi:hypothetical protein